MPNASDHADLVDEFLAGFELIKVQMERTMKQAKSFDNAAQLEILHAAGKRIIEDCNYYIGRGTRTRSI